MSFGFCLLSFLLCHLHAAFAIALLLLSRWFIMAVLLPATAVLLLSPCLATVVLPLLYRHVHVTLPLQYHCGILPCLCCIATAVLLLLYCHNHAALPLLYLPLLSCYLATTIVAVGLPRHCGVPAVMLPCLHYVAAVVLLSKCYFESVMLLPFCHVTLPPVILPLSCCLDHCSVANVRLPCYSYTLLISCRLVTAKLPLSSCIVPAMVLSLPGPATVILCLSCCSAARSLYVPPVHPCNCMPLLV